MSAQAPVPFRVVIVDDSQTMRRWLGSMVSADPRLELVGVAASAQEARQVIKQTNPDVMTLDVDMPEMDGLEFLAHVMRLRPMPVVMLSGTLRRNEEHTRRAHDLGAAACLAKPTIPTPEALAHLCDGIVAAARRDRTDKQDTWFATDKVILIGASTGGVTALEQVLPQLPENGPPVVIAQHMPHGFLERFIERLDRHISQNVDFAKAGDRLAAGQIRMAPAHSMQTALAWYGGAWHVHMTQRRPDDAFCPSVDVLFGSAAPWASKVGAMLLTGIGNDGAKGLLMLRQNGARTMAQSERSCAVYGMPAAALAMDAVDEEHDIDRIGTRLMAALFDAEREG